MEKNLMKKNLVAYTRIHIYIPAYLYEKVQEHKDMLKGRLSAICQEAIEDYISLNVLPYKEWKTKQAAKKRKKIV